jgi:CheY-like chemotaxis protein
MNDSILNVLVVDDDDVSINSIVRAISKQKINSTVIPASDGAEALRMLRGEHSAHHLTAPLVILLDLNMPGLNGMEFLQQLRSDPELHHNVVFVWTTSNNQVDMRAAYGHHVAGYLVKSGKDRNNGYLSDLVKYYQENILLQN